MDDEDEDTFAGLECGNNTFRKRNLGIGYNCIPLSQSEPKAECTLV